MGVEQGVGFDGPAFDEPMGVWGDRQLRKNMLGNPALPGFQGQAGRGNFPELSPLMEKENVVRLLADLIQLQHLAHMAAVKQNRQAAAQQRPGIADTA